MYHLGTIYWCDSSHDQSSLSTIRIWPFIIRNPMNALLHLWRKLPGKYLCLSFHGQITQCLPISLQYSGFFCTLVGYKYFTCVYTLVILNWRRFVIQLSHSQRSYPSATKQTFQSIGIVLVVSYSYKGRRTIITRKERPPTCDPPIQEECYIIKWRDIPHQ